MQISSVQGNISAREISSAVNLCESTVELLQRESYKWVESTPPSPYLNRQADEWYTLTPTPVDHNGRVSQKLMLRGDILFKQRFCVHYRLEPKPAPWRLISGEFESFGPSLPFSEQDFAAACAQTDWRTINRK